MRWPCVIMPRLVIRIYTGNTSLFDFQEFNNMAFYTGTFADLLGCNGKQRVPDLSHIAAAAVVVMLITIMNVVSMDLVFAIRHAFNQVVADSKHLFTFRDQLQALFILSTIVCLFACMEYTDPVCFLVRRDIGQRFLEPVFTIDMRS